MNCNQDSADTVEAYTKADVRYMSGAAHTASAAPRPGNIELAEDLKNRVYNSYDEALEREIIRAREIGQRKGREDQQKRLDTLAMDNLSLRKKLALSEMERTALAMKPVIFYCDGARIGDLERLLEEARRCNSAHATNAGKLRQEIAQLTQELAKAQTANNVLHKPIHISRVNAWGGRTILATLSAYETMSGLFIEVA